jgi:hypothetical protein
MAAAQEIPGEKKQPSPFVKTVNDTLSPAGYWFVKTKDHAGTTQLPFSIARQISGNEIIIRTDNKQQGPAHSSFLSVQPANDYWKLSPYLLEKLLAGGMNEDNNFSFQVQATNISLLKQWMGKMPHPYSILHEYRDILVIRASLQTVKKTLLPSELIRFITIIDRLPKEEINIIGFDNSVNKINKVQSNYASLNGNGTVVSIKENKPDSADIDFNRRYVSTPLSSNNISSHATIMATIISGGGNSFYTAKGVAWNSHISSSSFAVLLPDNDAAYQQYKITVQNHSYGTGIENFYGADAAAYDASVNNNGSLLHVFSSGNSGNMAAGPGPYNGVAGFANITGSFKMSKNNISVGSVDSFYHVAVLSSKGPAYDGRIKPELTAFGEDGSSGAAALVSGTALLLQQVYKNQHVNTAPDAALVKAVLLNSADDIGNKGIDFSSGFGNLNAWRAIQTMQQNQFFTGTATQSSQQNFSLTLPANVKQLKVLLVWTDKPAAANAFTALVNDLDIALTHVSSAQTWQPWVLNSIAHKDSLQLLPVRKRDSLNNVEQITIDDPPAGNYTIDVKGFNIPGGPQSFYVVYQWDTINSFQWTYPARNDNLLPRRQNTIRWESNRAGNGLLEYKWAGTAAWLRVSASLAAGNNYYKWMPPDTSAVAQLRMTISGQSYVSDTFTISPRTETGVGFNCPDSFLLYWSSNPARKYILYRLEDQYLAPLQTTSDSSVILGKATNAARWYAVAPLLSFNKTALRSFAFDYTQQGVGCYIKTFTADLAGNTARLQLELGSTYQVKRITIEKLSQAGYRSIQVYQPPLLMNYSFTDAMLVRGSNVYRVKIELVNGNTIYGSNETVYYFNANKYLVYPNPVQRHQSIRVIAAELNNPVFTLFNAWGQKVFEKTLLNLTEEIPTGKLSKGVYFYVLFRDGKKDESGRIVIE